MTLKEITRIYKSYHNIRTTSEIIIKETFILYTIFQSPKKPNTEWHTSITIKQENIWYLELENTESLWKIFKYEIIWITLRITLCSYHATYAFQSESTLYNCLNVKELLARNRRENWSLSDCNGTRTHNHVVRKWTLNHLAKLAKWLRCVVSTCMYSAFDCMFLSCQVRVSEWIHTL